MEFEVSLRLVLRNIGNVDRINISSFQETGQNPSKAIKHRAKGRKWHPLYLRDICKKDVGGNDLRTIG